MILFFKYTDYNIQINISKLNFYFMRKNISLRILTKTYNLRFGKRYDFTVRREMRFSHLIRFYSFDGKQYFFQF